MSNRKKNLALNPAVETERSIDHTGSEKKPRAELYSSGGYWSIVERLNQQLGRMENESHIKF